ncbi:MULTISPECIES: hypothetical protein [Myroides]|uniref:Lipoprotein n=1 Tax=Myroides albus TaxID=2562892 RepID=A0A6I3LGU3_9FLAO|nr:MULTISPECIES: hypothetical protein [Myroides]MTG97024.1 hypothetical protein [Myroides albus]MVX35804.1 hypothetical protein [Myroides sp. LoEW2-1]UVD78551.1 hypothetical protein NWE55_10455 [Myroides albus]
MMRNLLFLLLFSAMILTSCEKKGEPSPVGELYSAEQILNLPKDKSLDGKLIQVEGYISFCSKRPLRMNSKNKITITTEQYCQGTKLIDANIFMSSASVSYKPGGETPRNYISVTDINKVTADSMVFILDDYSEDSNEKFMISGKLLFDGSGYSLEELTFIKAAAKQ